MPPLSEPSTTPLVSVVIPTYQRMDVLPEVLDAVEAQRGAPPFEVVVVDDGSGDDTRQFLAARRFAVPARVLVQENSGPAAARNAGVRAATGRWVAFLGDDTVPTSGWLARHVAAHRERGGGEELAVIGYTRWHPRVRRSRFLDYINEYGLQFGYRLIDDPEDVPFNFFYTSNLSLSRSRLLEQPFDERFPYAAWEDIEALLPAGAGRSASAAGLRAAGRGPPRSPDRSGAVHGPGRRRRATRRWSSTGSIPELGGFLGVGPDGPPPSPSARRQQTARERLARALQNLPVRTPRLWEEVLRFHYIAGLQRAWREGAGSEMTPDGVATDRAIGGDPADPAEKADQENEP